MWRLTDEQRELREHIKGIVHEKVRPKVVKIEEGCDYPYDIHRVLGEEGLLGLHLPEAYGGRDASTVSWCAYIEELAKVSGTVALMASYVELVSLPLVIAGTDEQKERVLPGLGAGELFGSYALSEPHVGSDPAALTTTAEKRGDRWVINGEKRFIGNAGMSDWYVVFARTGDPGSKGISCFLVPGDADGLTVEPLPTMGMPGWKLGAPRFEDVEVGDDALIGSEGEGFRIAMITFDRSRPTVGAQGVGVAQGAVDLALDYAMRRHAFGQPLVGHEGIQFKLAELEAEVAAARALTFQAASFADAGDPRLTKIAAMSKLIGSDAAMHATTECVQVLGGNGYLKDFPAERMMRDAKVLQIYEGANEIQKLVIARQMVKAAHDRDPIWPEVMPGAEGVASGKAAPEPGEQNGAPERQAAGTRA